MSDTPMQTNGGKDRGLRGGLAGMAIVSRGLLFFAGIFMMAFGIMDKHVPDPDEPTGAAVKYLGPHGNAIAMVGVGALITVLASWLLARTLRNIRAAKTQGLM